MPEPTKYKVLCWRACNGNPRNKCGIDYISTHGAVWQRAETGRVITDINPLHVNRQQWIERGVLEEIKK